ncbi:hypothetical protein [Streptomyces bullii]|uniref:Integral membrane protein n=1 Tax=Streptomyces bullii TaxID=349910 RepID=A0ABW0UTR2_9ACTN
MPPYPLITLIALTVVVAAVALIGRGRPALSRRSPRRPDPAAGLRVLAGLTGAAAVCLYAWGALAVAGAVLEAEDGGTSSAPLGPCLRPDRQEDAGHVIGYSVDYVPLRFVCETADGRDDFTSDDVPGYVNPGVAVLALAAAGSAVAAGYAGELRARAEARRGERTSSGTV